VELRFDDAAAPDPSFFASFAPREGPVDRRPSTVDSPKEETMPLTNDTRFRVALVGRRLEDNENLGLAYLRAALLDAGFEVETHILNDGRDVGRIGTALLRRPPALLGMSLTDGGSAFLPLALGELLQAHGYRGHVTAGGPFATLARRWLLERYRWLGSVVRFAGEVPLPELARRLATGRSAAGIPGITTRDGDGPPAPVLDGTPLRLRPARDELPGMLGHRAAHVSATRGCLGRCLYCGPAAIQSLERSEGQRAGVPTGELDRCGVGGVRRRELDDVCDEMAELWHERDVRYFYFVDEHLLPYGESDALAFLERWRRGLERRKVGRFGIGGMLRADRLTPAVAQAFAGLGLIRVFVGLEFATPDEARRFGRRAPGTRELELLTEFARLGVVTVSNLMLVHPYSTPATLAAGIDFLARIPHGSFEATRMMAYHGTRLCDRLAAEGRLLGNPLRYGYRHEDPVVERFAETFSRLRGEVFSDYSIGYRTHDAHLALALRRRLGEPMRAGLDERLGAARRAVNELYVRAFRDALEWAGTAGDDETLERMLDGLRGEADELTGELQRIEAQLLADAPRGSRLFAPMRAAAAGAISFCLMTGSGACGGRSSDSGTRVVSEVREDAATAAADIAERSAAAPVDPPAEPDAAASIEEATAAVEDAAADAAEPEPVSSDAECADWPPGLETERRIKRIVHDVDPCFAGYVGLDAEGRPSATARVEWLPGSGLGLDACEGSGGVQAMETRVEEALRAQHVGCGLQYGSYLNGITEQNIEQLGVAIGRICNWGAHGFKGFTIVLDSLGRVKDVRSTAGGEHPTENDVLRCIRSALDGLEFACLANMSVCSEWVIIE
jgi:hypothetical protein